MAVVPHEQIPALDASYRTIRVLAEGPGGLTELVRGPQGQVLVRKRIPQELANVHAWMTLTRVESPLLPHIDSLYELDGDIVVVLSYVDGITLEELVGSTGPLGVQESVRYLCELCEAVGVLHANGIVHRDLSPGNVVVAGGSARIIDLGNARVHSEGAPRDTTTLGTFGFAAPEQFGFAQTDARSDIYSLGSLLGYMLTGLRPDDPDFDLALADTSRVPADLRLIVQRCREFEPSRRFQSTAELAAAAQGFATPSTPWQPPVPQRPNEAGLAWDDVGLLRGLALIGAWIIVGIFALTFVNVAFTQAKAGEPFGPVANGLIWALAAIASLAGGYQVHLALLHRGRYAVAKSCGWRLVFQLVLIAAAYVVAIAIVAAIATYAG